MIEVDGSRGEGGGQIVRTAVALAAATETSVRITNVRAARSNPGLRPQHCTAIEACADICSAQTEGVETGARTFEFRGVGGPRSGDWSWSVGTAGSATLVIQSVVPPLLRTEGCSTIVVEGGTHTRNAPIWEHLERCYVPAIERIGATVDVCLERHGFYPAGGGRLQLEIEPPRHDLESLERLDRGALRRLEVTAILADLPGHIARRELETFADELAVYDVTRRVDAVEESRSRGNALYASIESDAGTAILSEMGWKGRPAEEVATQLARQTRQYLDSGAAVDARLADQLVVPMALGGGGRFTTSEITPHCRTQLELIPDFLDVAFDVTETGSETFRVDVEQA